MKKLAILIPCYNEEKGVVKVIDDIPFEVLERLGLETQIIVIDNRSTDNTAKYARDLGARVVQESTPGKGSAMITGFKSLDEDTDYVIMMDGDNTYKASEIPRLLEPLINDFCDVIVGTRLGGKASKDALKFKNRIGNWLYTFLVRQFYQANVTDVLSGYFAWKKKAVDKMTPHLKANGFAIEMEMITKMVKLGLDIFSVPITYDQREGETKLNTFIDGIKILRMFVKNLFWKYEK